MARLVGGCDLRILRFQDEDRFHDQLGQLFNWDPPGKTTLPQETDVTSQEHLVQMLRKRGPCEEQRRQPSDSSGKCRWHRRSCSEKN